MAFIYIFAFRLYISGFSIQSIHTLKTNTSHSMYSVLFHLHSSFTTNKIIPKICTPILIPFIILTNLMGSTTSNPYSVDVPGQQQYNNSTKVRRNPKFLEGLIDSPYPQTNTLQLILQKSFRESAKHPCLGQIITHPGTQQRGQIKMTAYKTYQQIGRVIQTLNKAIFDLKLSPDLEEVAGLKLRFIGIFSKNRIQWIEVFLTAAVKGYVVAPIYQTLGIQNIPYVLNHTNLTTLFCSKESMATILKCQNMGSVKNIVSFDEVNEETVFSFKSRGIQIFMYNQLLEKYKNLEIPIQQRTMKPNDVFSFSYTSGTTGPPKGAMISQRNFAAMIAVFRYNPILQVRPSDVHLSFLPLPHVLQACVVFAMFAFGARVCAFGGDIKNIKQDLQVVKPTIFVGVPRLFNKFYDGVNQKLSQAVGCKKALIDHALSTKLKKAQQTGSYSHMVYDLLVFNKTKQLLGGNVRMICSGSAPLRSEVHSFMKAISCVPVFEGYGQTQSTGVSFLSQGHDKIIGHVGGPSSMCEFRLLDIPQMNYTHKDVDQEGKPMPRGEVLIRGPGVFLGYYKDDQKTKQAIDSEGWLHTGDVGTILIQNGALKLIDRKKNIFKLQQGQYVASEKVETVYLKKSDMVLEVFLYGDSQQNFCVAMISPVKAWIQKIAIERGIQGNYQSLCKNILIRKYFLNELNSFSKKQGLNSFEQAKNIYLEPLTFQERNILTTTMKLQRFAAKITYKNQIQQMYKEGMLE